MALNLRNFRLVGFDGAAESLFINDDGLVASGPIAGADVIDCGGSWLSPGWCDLHVHVWHGGTDISVRPQEAGRATGVTAMADAGSAGEAAFHGLREYVIEPGQETIRAFLNIGSIGLVACNRVSELIAPDCSIDVDRTIAVAEANRDVICGIKVRASGVITRGWGISPAKIAKRVAEILDLPLMVHVGEPDPLIDEVLEILTPGDIVTHCFNGKKAGSIGDTPKVFALARRLADEGVRMDIGHGQASFSFDMARRAIADGLRPFSISTDLHLRNIAGPVHDMATTMSKLLAVGLPFEEVIACVTERPRPILGLDGTGGLTPGARADLTLFDLVDHREIATDSLGATLEIDRFFEPRMTIIGASALPAARRVP
ncbi:amidohydrolase/deacetylase family metallohydrolase [Tropicimonas sp. IMCC6043]|uniref:amidohydrolase/deacetylase family metallohydrolase n=1 Tax=Tropicimonas sp. IMCC6043 TaxID=2510645 RepID=UPI00101B94AB|nr:amidohydrolase/deacetylase family metallohydrolase [Tropicimonas sp. IMCC6043]RYH06310.1 amidohydrolase/deacetylase family metallohydrolase [Tropicimonas sp. IMCC6043]